MKNEKKVMSLLLIVVILLQILTVILVIAEIYYENTSDIKYASSGCTINRNDKAKMTVWLCTNYNLFVHDNGCIQLVDKSNWQSLYSNC